MFSTRWGIILWVVALLEARNVTKHGHRLGHSTILDLTNN